MLIWGGIALLLVWAADDIAPLGLAQSCSIVLQPGESVQEAIDEASDGAIICLGDVGEGGFLPLAPQRWSENLKIDKRLTLRGMVGPKVKTTNCEN
ncbi:hypothetical protein HYR54_16880 [Candidatus Acetothermia bacterium]|nr:hypothetical protein [Candidatus Acetothermia bacterium]